MITIFSSPRAFVDPHTITIQRNAIQSWLSLEPAPEVLLIGDDIGVADIAHEFAVRHISNVETNPRGIPLRSSMCKIAHREAKHDFLCIINADIIILSDFYDALSHISLSRFLGAGRRHNLDIFHPLSFHDPLWRRNLRHDVDRNGVQSGPSTIDYAVYTRSIYPPVLPPFPVNSFGWDPWFLYEHKRRRIPVIDLTPAVQVVHQNHESDEQRRLKWASWTRDPEAKRILRESGGYSHMMTLREADYRLSPDGFPQRSALNRCLSFLATNPLYRSSMATIRILRTYNLR